MEQTANFQQKLGFYKYSTYVLFVVCLILMTTVFYKCNSRGNYNASDLVNALNDTLRSYRDADSVQRAEILMLKTEKVSSFTDISTKDLELLRLQEVVKEYKNKLEAGSSITGILATTKVKKYVPTTTIVRDTVYYPKDSLVQIHSMYVSTYEDDWIKQHIQAGADTTVFDLSINNKYDVVVGYDRPKKKYFAEVVNYNPYSSIKSVRSYQVTVPKSKNFGVGPSVGLGYDFTKSKVVPYLGIGISYNLIKF